MTMTRVTTTAEPEDAAMARDERAELLKSVGRAVKARLPAGSTYCLVVQMPEDDELHLVSDMDELALAEGLRYMAAGLDRAVAERN